jgi:hypothetical protein
VEGKNVQNRWLVLARTAWLAITLPFLVLFVISLPVCYRQAVAFTACDSGSNVPPDVLRTGLDQLGLSIQFYAGYLLTSVVLFAFVYCGIGALIFWRKGNDLMTFFMSLWLVIFGTSFPPTISVLADVAPAGTWLAAAIQWVDAMSQLGLICFFLLFYLFPDGRFTPSWTRWLAAPFAVWTIVQAIFPDSLLNSDRWGPLPSFLFISGWGASMAYAQLYRYRYVSTPVQRQQTKWVVLGLATALIAFLAVGTAGRSGEQVSPSLLETLIASSATGLVGLFPAIKQPGVQALLYDLFFATALILSFLLIPLSIGFAVLRHRLWDVDILIRRTLVYGLLSILLGVLYFATIAVLQQGFGRLIAETSQLAVTGSTLAIAALFNPLRQRIQSVIDRRFYRRKYDAETILASFSTTVRNEVELERLTQALTAVVAETMGPKRIGIWLRKDAQNALRNDVGVRRETTPGEQR